VIDEVRPAKWLDERDVGRAAEATVEPCHVEEVFGEDLGALAQAILDAIHFVDCLLTALDHLLVDHEEVPAGARVLWIERGLAGQIEFAVFVACFLDEHAAASVLRAVVVIGDDHRLDQLVRGRAEHGGHVRRGAFIPDERDGARAVHPAMG
jgi:hypothetical protein